MKRKQEVTCFNCGRKLKVNADGSYACKRCGFWHEADKKPKEDE